MIAGSSNWSLNKPKPGMLAVQPHPDVSNFSIEISIVSPGSEFSIYRGPVTGFTFEKSKFLISSIVDKLFN